jgi:hypothetical protein
MNNLLFHNVLFAEIIAEKSLKASEEVAKAWQSTWDLAINGPFYNALANLGIILAGSVLLIWVVQFAKGLLDDESLRSFSELIWPFIVILLLLNNGSNLVNLTNAFRTVINNTNNEVIANLTSTVNLEETLASLSSYGVTRDRLNILFGSCSDELKASEFKACTDKVQVSANKLLDEYKNDNGANAKKLFDSLEGGAKNYFSAVDEVLKSKDLATAGQNIITAPFKLGNAFFSTVFGGEGIGLPNPFLVVLETFLTACSTAFQALIEVSFLLTGLIGPIPVALSLLPIGAKPIYAWITAFFSLGLAKLCFNICVGLTSLTFVTAGINNTLVLAIALGLLSPILALSLASGGGILIFNAIVAASASAASTTVNIARSASTGGV